MKPNQSVGAGQSREAGASDKEIAYVFALTMRKAAGVDDCWTHAVIGDLVDGDADGSCGCG